MLILFGLYFGRKKIKPKREVSICPTNSFSKMCREEPTEASPIPSDSKIYNNKVRKRNLFIPLMARTLFPEGLAAEPFLEFS